MSDAGDIRARLTAIDARMAASAARVGRDPDEVRLLLATKTVPASRVLCALNTGRVLLGENKVREGEEKAEAIAQLGPLNPPVWHLIGHLQTNKVKYALRYATCIQSVDRARLIEKLDARLLYEGRSIDIMLQINTSREPSKYGVAPEDAIALARTAARYDTLRVIGLMTIGRLGGTPDVARENFRLLRTLREQIVNEGIDGCTPYELSMGMSRDMDVAIEEGATMVRVGTAVFGEREYPDSYYWPQN